MDKYIKHKKGKNRHNPSTTYLHFMYGRKMVRILEIGFSLFRDFTPPPLATNKPVKHVSDKRQKVYEYLDPCELLADDVDFLLARLPMDKTKRKAIVDSYKAEWLAGIEAENNEVKKENAGRRAANTWLRKNHKKVNTDYPFNRKQSERK